MVTAETRQDDESPPLPALEQPRGTDFLFRTWTGRIMIVNTIVFLAMAWLSKSILMPTPEVLLAFGAKDPVGLARGEFWRYIAPNFVHIGLIHFAFNTLGLYYIGYQIETVLGPRWFVPVYLFSGVFGVVSSALFTVAVSAGASGALFGLLGAGYYIERVVAKKMLEITGARPRRRAYAGMVVVNLVFGALVPGIDNAAHLGGLVAGVVMTWAMLNIRPNRLLVHHPRRAVATLSVLGLLAVGGAALGMNQTFQVQHFTFEAWRSGDDIAALRYLSRALVMDPGNPDLHFRRGRILMIMEELKLGIDDLQVASNSPALASRFGELVKELEQSGRQTEAWQVRRMMEHNGM